MKNSYKFISLIEILTVVSIFARDLPDLPSKDPILKQFEVDKFNKVIRPYDRKYNTSSEIIAEGITNLRLECHATYPVQWIYTGNGKPIINTDISYSSALSTTANRNGDINQYVASIFLGPLEEQHTGRYQCSRTDYITSKPNLYVYVPGRNLFTSLQGKTIKINSDVIFAAIPCSVSNPNVQVSLYKLHGERLIRPVTTSDDAIVYDARKGFRINLKKVEDPEGRYICTARYNDLIIDVEYTITSTIPSKSPPPENYEEFKQRPEETCKGESCKQCDTHTDCPPMMNCYTDYKCRDPCTENIRCGIASMCRVIDHRPECYCPPGYVGDPTKECLHITRERLQRYP